MNRKNDEAIIFENAAREILEAEVYFQSVEAEHKPKVIVALVDQLMTIARTSPHEAIKVRSAMINARRSVETSIKLATQPTWTQQGRAKK